ncbi:HNH endonuclease [Labrys monachus]|uniref:Uncharacterized protein n=1 Tax=Labrys monachus TaxID=217067 RepID=A0ABU0FFE7_9HYPH|nr:HNH endonuclease [Labrys monachus]MDQ0393181.1 hypothetical protein [Labrys monachus]
MPRFPDYVAQEGLAVPAAPQIQAYDDAAKALQQLGQTVGDVAARWLARQKQQADFDDQVAFQRHTLAQDQALQQARAGMAPEATGFHDAVMAGRAQADDAFLKTVSPANRQTYAGLLTLDRDRTSLAAARMEFEGRGAYEQAAFGQSAAAMADQVRVSPGLLPSALGVLKAQQANQSSVPPAVRATQWTATQQALQTAGWQGRHGDDPSGRGLAELGMTLSPEDRAVLPLMMDEGPVDPSVDTLTPAQRRQLALDWQTNQTQKQAAAQADIAGLQQRLADMPLAGTLQGPPPDRNTFIAAYGPEEGTRRFDEADAFVSKDAPAITALLHQPDRAQDAALAHYAATTASDGQRFLANAAAAVARYRAARAADPVGTLGKLYPALARSWQALEGADPATLRQNLPGLVDRTAALMDAAGVPAGERRYLPRAMASAIVGAFADTSRPMAERIGPLRDTIAAIRDPARQYALFRQLVDGGIPRLLEPAVAAYARGDNAAAGRLFAAVLSDPGQTSAIGAAAPASPVALDNAAIPPAPPRPGAGTDIDLSASAASQIAHTAGMAGIDPSPIAQALFPRLVRNNLKTNGGDIPAANALAAADLRKPGGSDAPIRYAYLLRTDKSGPGQSGILVPKPQAPEDGGSAINSGAADTQAAGAASASPAIPAGSHSYRADITFANQDPYGPSHYLNPSWMTDPDYLRAVWAEDQSLDDIQQAYRDAQARGDRAAQRSYAMAYVAKEHQQSPTWMWFDDRARAVSRGIPIVGGAADEFEAGLNAPLSAVIGDGKAYEEALDYQRARDSYFDQNYPWTSNALQFAGTVAGTAAFGAPSSLGGSAAMGVAIGGADGFMRGEGGFRNRMEAAAWGAAVGGVMGAAAPLAGRAASRLGRSLADKYPAMFRQAGQRAAEANTPVPAKGKADTPSPSPQQSAGPPENPQPEAATGASVDKNKTGSYYSARPDYSGALTDGYRKAGDTTILGPWGPLAKVAPQAKIYFNRSRTMAFSFDEQTGSVTRINTSLKQRLDKSGNKSGTWISGERGNGSFLSNNPAARAATNGRGVEYIDGSGKFDPHSLADVELENMSADRDINFDNGDLLISKNPALIEKLGIQAKNKSVGVTPRDVEIWRKANGYTWHEHHNLRTLQLIPSVINNNHPHFGGVGEINAARRLYNEEIRRWER